MALGCDIDIVIRQSGSESRGTLRFAAPELGRRHLCIADGAAGRAELAKARSATTNLSFWAFVSRTGERPIGEHYGASPQRRAPQRGLRRSNANFS